MISYCTEPRPLNLHALELRISLSCRSWTYILKLYTYILRIIYIHCNYTYWSYTPWNCTLFNFTVWGMYNPGVCMRSSSILRPSRNSRHFHERSIKLPPNLNGSWLLALSFFSFSWSNVFSSSFCLCMLGELSSVSFCVNKRTYPASPPPWLPVTWEGRRRHCLRSRWRSPAAAATHD